MQVSREWGPGTLRSSPVPPRETLSRRVRPNGEMIRFVNDEDPQWEARECDSHSGAIIESVDERTGGDVRVAFDVCLSIRVLIHDLYERFPNMLTCHHLEGLQERFVHIRDGCRSFELLLGWPFSAGKGGIALFVLVDMMSCEYQVLRWVRTRPEVSNVSKWVDELQSYRTQSYKMFGSNGPSIDDKAWWYFLEKNKGDPYWTLRSDDALDFLLRRPFCFGMIQLDAMDNRCVLEETPVDSIRHDSVPITLSYM